MARLPICGVVLLVAASFCHAKDSEPAKYAFTQPPLAVFERLVELKLGEAPQLQDAEREFLKKVSKLRSDNYAAKELADEALILQAMLFASGLEDPAAHGKYREQYEKLVAAAKEATKGAKNDRERGEALMKFLHQGVMSKGYDIDVTTLTAIFDDGKYNCVSSTALYYLVGSRLGLKLKLISIPGAPFMAGHASLDLLDGAKRLQVEPTNEGGFDWQTKIKRPGVVVIGFVPDRKEGREVDPLGLAATIYSNRGVDLGKNNEDKGDSPRRLDSARLYASALALDPLTPTATHNLIGLFTNWGPELAKEEQFEDGIRVLSLGRSLSPQTRDLEGNLDAVWSKYITATLAGGKDKKTLDLLRRAALMLPKERDYASPSVWFIGRAQDRQKEAGWEAGLAAVETSLPLLAGPEAKKLTEWRSGLFRRWSQEHLEKGEFDDSVKALARGLAIDAQDREIHSGLGYHTAEALKQLDAQDAAAAVKHFQALLAQFPAVKNVAEAGRSHAVRQVHELTEAGKFSEALVAVERYKPLVTDARQHTELGGLVYCLWGQNLRDEKKWKESLAKFMEGRKVFPKDGRLEDGMCSTIDTWAKGFMDDNKWDEAIGIYNVGLTEYLPNNSHLKGNKEYCEAKKKSK